MPQPPPRPNSPRCCLYASECAETGPGIDWYPGHQAWLGPRCAAELARAGIADLIRLVTLRDPRGDGA